jgi:WD40 repeat protein
VSDEDSGHGVEGFLVNRARRRQAAPPPPPARAHDFNRTAVFKDPMPGRDWLSAAWSPDGSQVAVGGRTDSDKGAVLEIWNAQTGHHESHSVRHLTHHLDGQVVSVSWAPSGSQLATVETSKHSGLTVLNIRSLTEAKRAISLPEGAEVSQAAWSPDGSLLAVSARGARSTLLIDPASGQLGRTLEGLSGPVAWEPGGHRLAGPDGADIAIVDALTGQRERTISGQSNQATAVSWATQGKVLAVSDGEHIRVLDADSGDRLWNLPWATSEGDRSDDPSVHYIGWLDSGRYLLEFRKHGAWSRSDASAVISSITLWDVTTRSLFGFLFEETLQRRQLPPAEILVPPQGGRQCLIMDDHLAPRRWEITGDLPGFLP